MMRVLVGVLALTCIALAACLRFAMQEWGREIWHAKALAEDLASARHDVQTLRRHQQVLREADARMRNPEARMG